MLLADCRCTVILHSRAAGMASFCLLVMAPIVQEHSDGLLPVRPLSLSDHVAALVLRFLLELQVPLPGWISFAKLPTPPKSPRIFLSLESKARLFLGGWQALELHHGKAVLQRASKEFQERTIAEAFCSCVVTIITCVMPPKFLAPAQ